MGMGIVSLQGEVLVAEIEDRCDVGIEPHERKRPGRAFELGSGLIMVVEIEMDIPEGVDEFSWSKATHLGHHQSQKSIACYVEGNAKKDVRAALVKLAG